MPFAALAALESGRYDRRTVIDTSPGYLHVGAKLISDPVNYEVLTLAESLAKSSQVAFVKVALDLEEDAVFDVIQRAGIGEPVGTGLPGEQVGFLDGSQLRYPQVRMALAYGYACLGLFLLLALSLSNALTAHCSAERTDRHTM